MLFAGMGRYLKNAHDHPAISRNIDLETITRV